MRIALLLALLLIPPAHADGEITGNQMLTVCTGNQSAQLGCLYFVMGIQMGAMFAAQEYEIMGRPATSRYFCMPPEVTAGQARDILVRYLQTTPITRHLPAGLLAYQAYKDAYPCGESQRSP